MAMTPTERKQLVDEIAAATANQVLWAKTYPNVDEGIGANSIRQNIGSASSAAQATLTVVRELASRSGVDVDEAAIARELLAGLTPQITEAVRAAVAERPDGTADEISDLVVTKLGSKLTA